MTRNDAIKIFLGGCNAVLPEVFMPHIIKRQDSGFSIGNAFYSFNILRKIYLVSMGKAASAMALELQHILGDKIDDAMIVTKDGHGIPGLKWAIREAGHPLPDNRSVEAAFSIIEMAQNATVDDLLILLISGGASALVTDLPVGITLEDLQWLSGSLLRAGANIHELNTVRKHLSELKGGQLARHAYPARVHSIVLSDVPGDELSVIASGPAFPDDSTFRDATSVLDRYDLNKNLALGIKQRLSMGVSGKLPENPGSNDPVFRNVRTELAGSNSIALEASFDKAVSMGYGVKRLPIMLEGETKEAAEVFMDWVYSFDISEPTCFIAGGETTVTVNGNGKGGRNQEFVLACLQWITEKIVFPSPVILSGGTDGTDGPTDAAGAIIDPETIMRVNKLNLDINSYLLNNDAYHFFEACNGLLKTGPTNTNVMDIVVLLRTI